MNENFTSTSIKKYKKLFTQIFKNEVIKELPISDDCTPTISKSKPNKNGPLLSSQYKSVKINTPRKRMPDSKQRNSCNFSYELEKLPTDFYVL